MVEKLSENQFTNMSDDTVSNSIIIENTQQSSSKHSNFEFEAKLLCIFEKILVSLNMYAILEKPLILGNKINL